MTSDTEDNRSRSGEGPDSVEHLLAKSLDRFGRERRKRQAQMEETVQEFALKLFEEESKQSEGITDEPDGQGQSQSAETAEKAAGSEIILVALDPGLVRQLRAAAAERQTSVSSLVESAVADWIEGEERMKRTRQQLRPPR